MYSEGVLNTATVTALDLLAATATAEGVALAVAPYMTRRVQWVADGAELAVSHLYDDGAVDLEVRFRRCDVPTSIDPQGRVWVVTAIKSWARAALRPLRVFDAAGVLTHINAAGVADAEAFLNREWIRAQRQQGVLTAARRLAKVAAREAARLAAAAS